MTKTSTKVNQYGRLDAALEYSKAYIANLKKIAIEQGTIKSDGNERLNVVLEYCKVDIPEIKDSEKYKLRKKNLSKALTGKNNPLFGKHLSQATKDKIGKANSGEKNGNFGKCFSQKERDKLSKALLGQHRTQATKDRMRQSKLGKKNPRWKEKIHKICPACNIGFDVIPSQKNQKCCSIKCSRKAYPYSGEKNGMFGKHHTQTTKDKLSKTLKGRKCKPFTQEHKVNLSKAFQNRSPEEKKLWKEKIGKANKGRLVGEKNPNFGKPRSQATRNKISKALSGEKNSSWKEKIQKVCPICNIEFKVIPSKRDQECCSRKCSGKLHSEENSPMFGKKNSALAEWNRQHSGEKHSFFGTKRPEQAERMKGKDNPMFGMIGEKNHLFGKRGEGTSMFGKHHSQEAKDKMRQSSLGEKNPNYGKRGEEMASWQGGISFKPYTPDFNDQLKESIRKRDGYRCQKCGLSELEEKKKLSIHHIDHNKKNCSKENLITLCQKCNNTVNYNRKKWTKYFQRKMEKGYNQSQLCLARV